MDMKHLFFKSLLIALLVLFAGGGISAADKTETIYFYQLYDNGDVVETVEGTDITITFNKGTNSNAPKYFTTGTAIRAYGGNYFTVTAYGNKITKIVIGFGSPGDGNNSITTNGGKYSSGTWTGNAESVTFTVGGSSGNRRIASIAVTYDFEQGQGTLDPQNSFANATENTTVGEPYTVQEITTLSKGRKRYKSSDVSVATIDGSGKVTLKKAGETTITVTTAADDTYQEGSASYTLIVSKGTPTLSFASDIVNLIVDEDFTPSLTNPSGVEITYSIDDPAIAELQNKNTGYLKALKAGTATVRATSVENGSYLSAEATFTLVVSEKLSAEGSYKWVKDDSTLAAGDELVIVYQTNDTFAKVMGNQQANNFKYVDVRYSIEVTDRSIISISSDNVAPIMLEGSEGAWYFRTNNGYLYAASSSSNYLRTAKIEDNGVGDNAKATISIADNGNATVVFKGDNSRNNLRYNSDKNALLFSCYTSSSDTKLVQIYRKVNDVTLAISSVGYATMYYSDRSLKVPTGVTAKTYKVESGKLTESKTYSAGDIIPKDEAVVLKGAKGEYKFIATTTDALKDADNQLKGTDEAKMTIGGNYYYALQASSKDGKHGPGFYWMDSEGTNPFLNGAHKAYLALDKKFSDAQEGGAKSFYLFEETTGICNAQADGDTVKEQHYNLSGQRVGSCYKGIVIVNGKKFMKK